MARHRPNLRGRRDGQFVERAALARACLAPTHLRRRSVPSANNSPTLLHYPSESMTQRYLEVALPVPLRSAFTYAVPDSFNGEELVGRRVLVPFRNRPMVGVGLALAQQAPETKRIKEIAELLDPLPALPPKLIELGHWISRYYLAPIGETFRAMLPPEIELRHDREYWLTDAGRAYLQALSAEKEITDVEKAELDFLRAFDLDALRRERSSSAFRARPALGRR